MAQVDGASTMSNAQARCHKNSWAVALRALHCLQTVMEQAGFTAHPLIFFLLYLNFTYLPPFALPGLDFPLFPPLRECLPSVEQAQSLAPLSCPSWPSLLCPQLSLLTDSPSPASAATTRSNSKPNLLPTPEQPSSPQQQTDRAQEPHSRPKAGFVCLALFWHPKSTGREVKTPLGTLVHHEMTHSVSSSSVQRL